MFRSNKRKAAPAPVESESDELEGEGDREREGDDEDSLDDELPADEFDEEVEEEGEEEKGDGLANTMAQLLQQNVGNKLPVLAGRKTKIMKEIEASKKETIVISKKREERRKKIVEKMGTAMSNDLDLEKQLRRLATKGVVALFNAVASSKREAALEGETKKKSRIHDNASLLSSEQSLNRPQQPKQEKGWKAVTDDQIPLDWDNEDNDD